MLTFLVLHTTEMLTKAQNDLHFICGNILFSGQIGSHACFSKLFCKCNFSSLLVWPSCCCLGFLPLEGRSFSMTVLLLFQQIQATLHFKDTLLTHSHRTTLAWSAGHSQEQVVGEVKEPAPCPLSQAGWLEYTHCLLMRAQSMFAKLPFPGCSCILCKCRLPCYFLCSFASSFSLGFACAFPGTRTRFCISTAPSTETP